MDESELLCNIYKNKWVRRALFCAAAAWTAIFVVSLLILTLPFLRSGIIKMGEACLVHRALNAPVWNSRFIKWSADVILKCANAAVVCVIAAVLLDIDKVTSKKYVSIAWKCVMIVLAAIFAFSVCISLFPALRGGIIHLAEVCLARRKLNAPVWDARFVKWAAKGIARCKTALIACAAASVFMKRDNDKVMERVLYGFALANIAVIISALSNQWIWLDEMYTLNYANMSYSRMLQTMACDVNCPLYFIIIKSVIGFAHWALPSASVIVIAKSVSALPVILLVAVSMTKVRRNWGRLCGAFFAVCATSMPQMTHFAVEVRMYSWLMLFVALAFLFAYDCAASPLAHKTKKNWVLLTICAAACCYTHYYGAVSAAAVYAILLIWYIIHDKKQIRICLLSGVAAVLLSSPWLVYSIKNFIATSKNGYWAKPIGATELLELLSYPFDIGGRVGCKLLFVYAIAILHFVFNRDDKGKEDKSRIFAAISSPCVYIFTVAAGCIVSWIVRPMFVARYASQGLPLIYLSLAIMLSWRGRIKINGIVMIIVSIITLHTNVCGFARWEHFESKRWTQSMSTLSAIKKGDTLISTYSTIPVLFNCFDNDVRIYLVEDNSDTTSYLNAQCPNIKIINSLDTLPETQGNVYFVIRQEEVYDFLSSMGKTHVRFVGNFHSDWQRKMKLYILE